MTPQGDEAKRRFAKTEVITQHGRASQSERKPMLTQKKRKVPLCKPEARSFKNDDAAIATGRDPRFIALASAAASRTHRNAISDALAAADVNYAGALSGDVLRLIASFVPVRKLRDAIRNEYYCTLLSSRFGTSPARSAHAAVFSNHRSTS